MLVADAGLVGMHVIVALHSPRLLLQDYGNSETNDRDDGAGAMEAIYFGNAHWHGNTGGGATGPWVGADLEAGMYYGGGELTQKNNGSKALTSDFVSLAVKGKSDGFTIKGGDATKGELETQYDVGGQAIRQLLVMHINAFRRLIGSVFLTDCLWLQGPMHSGA